MANGPGLSTAKGGEVYVGQEFRESLTQLDVLYANHLEGQHLPPELIKKTEENFFRGAPPLWLNLYLSAQAESGGAGIQLIKRDGYDSLMQQVQQSRKCPAISTVKLFHQPGCGGTTLAMQVLWDLRKTFRCAVLRSSTSDMTSVAKAVVQLFTAGSRDLQNTVLLLLNDEQILDNLQDRIMEEIETQVILPHMPVVVLFCCLRKNAVLQGNHIVLRKTLSDTEMQRFAEKKEELRQQYPHQHEQFHGFNILQTNFSPDYARQVSTTFTNVRKAKRKLKTHLAAFLALLNTYVPGSYLLESQCLDFLKQKDSTLGGISLEPFNHLIVTFTESSEKRVRLAHPLIAQSCVELMAEEGVTRSGTARNFINFFCRDEVSQYLLGFFKDMLTKREEKEEENQSNGNEIREKRFSRLILDIQEHEGNPMSASVLKVASNKIKYPNKNKNQFFPQALARLYYIEIKNYDRAEKWAKEAKKRDSTNSFIADTLGQVYKNHLKKVCSEAHVKPREILRLATKAIEAFKDEEQLAEKESETDMKEDCNSKVSHVHNTRGKFGYLQVCEILYDSLLRHQNQNEIWKNVLTKNVSLGSVLDSLGDNKLFRFNVLIKSLREDVKEKCDFLNAFLTYTKPGLQKQDPSECWKNVSTCYQMYVKRPAPDLVKEIMDQLEDDEEEMSVGDADMPEPYIAAILKNWSRDNKDNSPNLKELIDKTKRIYESAIAKYFRSRYQRPLFYLGRDEAEGKIVPANKVHCLLEDQDKKEDFTNYMINKDLIFRDLRVQRCLFKCEGEIRDYSITTKLGGCDITMKANMRERTWVPRKVSFYIGFTIRGPVAFGIQSKLKGSPSTSETYSSPRNTQTWTPVKPKSTTTNNATTYSLQSEAGKFQCTKSALRWACSRKVSFTYQFKSWEEHEKNLKMVCCKPGGPLLDIRVTDGKPDHVYLPHWICVDDVSAASEKFAVLHCNKVGNFLEQISEVESSHVRLFHPIFTTNGVLVREG